MNGTDCCDGLSQALMWHRSRDRWGHVTEQEVFTRVVNYQHLILKLKSQISDQKPALFYIFFSSSSSLSFFFFSFLSVSLGLLVVDPSITAAVTRYSLKPLKWRVGLVCPVDTSSRSWVKRCAGHFHLHVNKTLGFLHERHCLYFLIFLWSDWQQLI